MIIFSVNLLHEVTPVTEGIKVDNYEIEDCNEETSYEDQNTFPSDIFKEEDDDDDY